MPPGKHSSDLSIRAFFCKCCVIYTFNILSSNFFVLLNFSGLSLFEFRYISVTQLFPNEIVPTIGNFLTEGSVTLGRQVENLCVKGAYSYTYHWPQLSGSC